MVALLCGCGPTQRVAWQLNPGDTYSIKVNLVSDLAMMFPNVDHKESEMMLTCRVKQVDPEQRATVEVEIASIKASMKSLGVKCSFDSQNDKEFKTVTKSKESRQQKYVNAFVNYPGQKYTVQIDSLQQTIILLDLDEKVRKASTAGTSGDMFGGDQVHMLLAEENLRQYVSGGLFTEPGAPKAKRGTSWHTGSSVLVPDTPRQNTQHIYTIDNVEKDTMANISYKILREDPDNASPRTKAPPPQPRSNFQVLSVKGEGQISFSLIRGRLLTLTEKIRVDLERKADRKKNDKTRKMKMYYVVKKDIEYIYE
ncbi:MAG: hypothetical protein JW860_01150 [Sedimentisphaerales bacterium]|nr:hypothetical protein [Sedimentisphaerales bacterium]